MNTPTTRFWNLIEEIDNAQLRDLASSVIDYPDFSEWPASLSFHHHYSGGLLTHTVEVAEYALAAASKLPLNHLSLDILTTAAIWHDFMKIRDYEKVPFVSDNRRHVLIDGGPEAFVASNTYSTIRHIQGSAIEFSVAARKRGLFRDIEDRVVHCLIAHHGRPEWGSPVEPQTVEALLLHHADMMSAKFGATRHPLT